MTTEPEGSVCRAVSQVWDSVVDDFLASRETRASLTRFIQRGPML